MSGNNRWVGVWANAVSVAENRPECYAKNSTIRYPIHIPFSGKGVRLTFDNYCVTEPMTLNKVTVFYGGEFYPVTCNVAREIRLGAGERIQRTPIEVALLSYPSGGLGNFLCSPAQIRLYFSASSCFWAYHKLTICIIMGMI